MGQSIVDVVDAIPDTDLAAILARFKMVVDIVDPVVVVS